ncbi:MAG: MarR family transcriptional regulator [Tissierellia bacterium]|nr:MarR family transcriptional regulator [Tissierellia bacterium]
MSDASIDDIKYNLLQFISLFHRLFAPTFKSENDDEYECTKNQIRAIMIIGKAKKISPTTLCQCMDMEKGSVTTLLYSLEKANLVYREDDPKDKRKVLIQLTDEGIIYYIKQGEKFLQLIKELFSTLPKNEIIKFNESLQIVVEVLEKVRDV